MRGEKNKNVHLRIQFKKCRDSKKKKIEIFLSNSFKALKNVIGDVVTVTMKIMNSVKKCKQKCLPTEPYLLALFCVHYQSSHIPVFLVLTPNFL